MKLVYNGPHLEVEVPTGEAATIAATRGEPVDVPDDVAKSLLEHGAGGDERPWSKATEAAGKTKKDAEAGDPS